MAASGEPISSSAQSGRRHESCHESGNCQMSIYSLKIWHWTAIGAVIGACLAITQVLSDSDERIGGPGFISQAEFETELGLPSVMDKPRIRSIFIHPLRQVDLVRFEQLDAETLTYRPALLAVPRPYQPVRAASDRSTAS